jgi:hypothetical protein
MSCPSPAQTQRPATATPYFADVMLARLISNTPFCQTPQTAVQNSSKRINQYQPYCE